MITEFKTFESNKYTLQALDDMLNEYYPYYKEGMKYFEFDKITISGAYSGAYFLKDISKDSLVYSTFEKLHHILMYNIIDSVKNNFIKLHESTYQDMKNQMQLMELLEPLIKGFLDIEIYIARNYNEVRVNLHNMNYFNGEYNSGNSVYLEQRIFSYDDLISPEEQEAKKFGL